MARRAQKKIDPLDEIVKWQTVFNRLKDAAEVVYDCETSGLDWRKQHIVGHVLTFGPAPQDSYYLPVRHTGGGNIGGAPGPTVDTNWDGKSHRVEPDLLKLLDRPDLTVTGHNIGFDLKFLSRLGFKFRPRFEDTIINAPLLDEWVGKYSLEACAARAGVQAKKSEVVRDYIFGKFPEAAKNPRTYMGHYWRLAGDDPIAVEYAEGDGTTTWQLRDVQMKEIDAQELRRVWDVESRLIPVLARMTTRGVKVDEERLSALRAFLKKSIGELEDWFPSGFNSRSPDDVRHWMEQHGHTNWPLTPKKLAPSFPESWLENYEAGQRIIRLRKFSNMKDSFVIPLMETHLWKGRVHADYNQLRGDEYGTITGRLSSSNPNMQQVPKRNEELGRLFRSVFVPDEGKIWAAVDYSQCEPRLLAHYSGCKVLVEGYNASPSIDAHSAVARAIAASQGKNWETLEKSEQKDRRETGKRVNQTLITGGGKGVLVSKYKIREDEVDRIWNDYFRAMPEIRALQKRASNKMQMRGYILSLLGRRARLLHHDKAYVALNRLLQCGNADVLKQKLVEVDEYLGSIGRPIDLLNNCHDAVDFQLDEGHRKVYDECLRIMQDFGPDSAIPLSLPMTVDAGEGKDWSTATYGEPK